MKSLKVVNISPGLSGAGLISDYLLNRDDFVNPFNLEAEFRLLHDPGGIHNLYKGLYENFSVNNSSYFFNEFERYIFNLKNLSSKEKNKKKYHYNSTFFNEVKKYLKEISLISYYGLPEYFRIGFDFNDKLKWRILRISKSSQEVKFCKMRIPVEKKYFLKKTKKFLDKSLYILSGKRQINYVIDQGGNFWDPIQSTQYFDNRKIVLITRDPRSIFSSMKIRKSLAYPGHDIKIFCEWYKNIMKNYNKIKENNILIKIKYENFILNHEKESKKLLKFLKLKDVKKKFDILESKKNIFKAKKNLTKKEKKYIEKKLKKYLQWPNKY